MHSFGAHQFYKPILMKKKSSLTAIAAIFITAFSLLTACADNSTPPAGDTVAVPVTPPVVYEVSTMDTVPLEEALADIKHYQDSCEGFFNGAVPIRSYTIHASDMLMAMGLDPSTVECPFTHARVYIGLNDSSHFKLFFTPVIGAELKGGVMNPGRDTILRNADGNQYVMDLNAPCPNTCDDTSPLYNPK
jgi:hypothetical protein